MKNIITTLIMVISVLLSFHVAQANIGLGTSPSKVVLQVQSGQETSVEILVFNPGDQKLKVSFAAEGDIAPFTTFSEESVEITPELQPHTLPIKNGKTTRVTFKPPASPQTKTYLGALSATGGPTEDAQFGGAVGVATLVTLTATPPPSVLDYITAQHIIIGATAIIILLMFIILKKRGLKLTFEKEE